MNKICVKFLNDRVYYAPENCVYDDKVIDIIQKTLNEFDKQIFHKIGQLWYYLIKNIHFCEIYHKMIMYELKTSNADHIDLRLKLGGHFDKSGKLNFEQELNMLMRMRQDYIKE